MLLRKPVGIPSTSMLTSRIRLSFGIGERLLINQRCSGLTLSFIAPAPPCSLLHVDVLRIHCCARDWSNSVRACCRCESAHEPVLQHPEFEPCDEDG